MNKIKLIAGIVLILTSFTFTSCDNEPIDSAIDLDDFENPTGGPMAFKADFSGETWTGTMAQAVVSGNFISIGAAKADGSAFSILVEAHTTGTFPANQNIIAYTPAGSEYGYWSINPANDTEDTGSITITSINTVAKTVSGTFSFKGYWSDTTNTSIIPVQFTNGVFNNIPYITQTQTGDTFFAKVAGTEFQDVDIMTTSIDFGGQNYTSIAADNASGDGITVSVKSDLVAGTYPITGNTATDVVQAVYSAGGTTDFNAVSGSVTIISVTSTHIKGTFNFVTNGTTLPAPYTITEGAFDVDL